ncbi:hypothetical protein ACTMSW_24820 [Micromonospora sp. BQ11]|uniref:hypothetical protein n=1 Tax=Micromonospora sp. BQ11 TaxID=3452212 RepID=UPI003F89B2CC
MTLPSDRQDQQGNEPDPATAPERNKRLDQPRESNGSWTVGSISGRTTTELTNVEAPHQAPELNPAAAAGLLKLLTRVKDRRPTDSMEDNA